MSQGRKEPHFGTNPLQQKPRELLVSFLHLPPLSFLYFPSPEHSLLGEKQENGNAGSTGCSKLCTQDTCGHRKLGELGAGWVEASVQSHILSRSSWSDSVTDGHVVFRLHQPKAVPAEVKLRDLHVWVDHLQIKLCQHKKHESAERWH